MRRLILTSSFILAPALLVAEDCTYDANNLVRTNHFFFSASSDSGAVGDVVGVDFSLTLEAIDLEIDGVHPTLGGFTLVGCYDSSSLELLDAVRYSDFFDNFAFLSFFYPEGGEAGRLPWHPRGVFSLTSSIRQGAVERFLSGGQKFPLMTVYFRVTREPGAEIKVYPCESQVVGGSCESSNLQYSIAGPSRFFLTLSSRHVAGTIRILPGEPTRPEPPPLPPDAKIYPEAPTPETANVHFELEGPLVATPGSTVLMDIFATSNFEFSGFMTALRFPPEYLALNRVEEQARPGIVRVDNGAGGFGLLMSNTRQRVGREAERVHLATLHFNVLEAAQSVAQIEVKFEPFENFFNWLAIHHSHGLNADDLPITAEVTPILLTGALLKVQAQPTHLGDVNLDYEVTITDAVNLLGALFRGEESVLCLEAADFNEDERIDISDAVAILNRLFRGSEEPSGRDILCNGSH